MTNEETVLSIAGALKKLTEELEELTSKVEAISKDEVESYYSANNRGAGMLRERPAAPYHNTFRAKIKQKGQVTIPSKVRKALNLEVGDSLLGVYDPVAGEMRLIEDDSVNPGRAWFWQDKWQEMLHQSMSDFVDGQITRVDSLEDVSDT
jgi:AbrB family looped-hinge helix DNA binding protein